LIGGFRDGDHWFFPINDGISGAKPGESEDDIFVSTVHDMEDGFLGNSFNVNEECHGIKNVAFLIGGLVDIFDFDGYRKAISGQLVLSNKGPVDTGDFCSIVNKSRGFNGFKSVRRCHKANGDLYCFGRR
jgi:hypothetical protein